MKGDITECNVYLQDIMIQGFQNAQCKCTAFNRNLIPSILHDPNKESVEF